MSNWVTIIDGFYVSCTQEAKNSFIYSFKDEEDNIIKASAKSSPLTLSANTDPYKTIKGELNKLSLFDVSKLLDREVSEDEKKQWINTRILEVKNELEDKMLSAEELERKESADRKKKHQKELDEHYARLYTDFKRFCDQDGNTPLEEIIAICDCLGVGEPKELVKAFLGFFQTVVGIKATNVIAIGSPASGKSFMLETALSMIPDEYVVKGTKSVGYFFRKYNGQDLTGKIFYLGDLGGEKSDEDTIQLRDLLKQLSTDGEISRGIVDTESMSDEEQIVTGNPSLAYTSANEDIINEQEKSRSMILTPADPDHRKVAIFKTVMENRGAYDSQLNTIERKKESIKGLVYHFIQNTPTFFNPYIITISDFLFGSNDYNRKIDEFNAILHLVTLLDDPFVLDYESKSIDDMERPVTSTSSVYLSNIKHNSNALNIFSSSNLLPDEQDFANGLIEKIGKIPSDLIKEEADGVYNLWDLMQEKPYDVDLILQKFISYKYLDDEFFDANKIDVAYIDDERRDYFFTKATLKSRARRNKWYSRSKDYIDKRLALLVDEAIIIKIGNAKQGNYNIYCVNPLLSSKIGEDLPIFSGVSVDEGKKVFKGLYPSVSEEYNEYIDNLSSEDVVSIFENVEPVITGLPYNDR